MLVPSITLLISEYKNPFRIIFAVQFKTEKGKNTYGLSK